MSFAPPTSHSRVPIAVTCTICGSHSRNSCLNAIFGDVSQGRHLPKVLPLDTIVGSTRRKDLYDYQADQAHPQTSGTHLRHIVRLFFAVDNEARWRRGGSRSDCRFSSYGLSHASARIVTACICMIDECVSTYNLFYVYDR